MSSVFCTCGNPMPPRENGRGGVIVVADGCPDCPRGRWEQAQQQRDNPYFLDGYCAHTMRRQGEEWNRAKAEANARGQLPRPHRLSANN